LNALIAGETDCARLADLTRGRLKATRVDLMDALHGRITDHHRFMIKLHLSQIDALESAVAAIEARIGDALGPFRAADHAGYSNGFTLARIARIESRPGTCEGQLLRICGFRKRD
jgi:hypothetical protein